MFKELTTTDNVDDEVDRVCGLIHFMKVNYMRML